MNPLSDVSYTPGHKIKGSAAWTEQSFCTTAGPSSECALEHEEIHEAELSFVEPLTFFLPYLVHLA